VLRAVRAYIVPIALLLARPAQAGADLSAAAELPVSGGYDSNIFLSSTPDANADLLRLGGWLVELAPALELAVAGGGFRLELDYDGDYRAAADVGHLYYQELALTFSPPELGPLHVQAGLVGGRFDASAFSADQFWFGGGQTGIRVAFTDALRLLASYRYEARTLSGIAGDNSTSHMFDTRLSYRPVARVELGPRLSYLAIVPPGGDGLRRWRAGVDANGVWQRWTVTAGAWVGPLSAPSESAVYVGAQIEVRRQVLPNLDLRCAGDWAAPISSDAPGNYARQSILAGVVLHATTQPRLAPAPVQDDLRPLVEVTRVRFRVRAPRATAVSVLGSWDDWAAPGRPLRQTADPALWELWLDLPAGTYRYHFMVDGEAVRPSDAPRYLPDGFGGEDGVVDVGAPEGAVVSFRPTGSYVR
jgi:hypothetical protein